MALMSEFVSRAGRKLEHALASFGIDVRGLVCADLGSNAGGFVDCLLKNGASKVYSVDTSYGELAWKLRNDPRVVVMERTNILHLTALPVIPSGVEGSPTNVGSTTAMVDLITIDAGWTKLELVLPVVKKFLKKNGKIIALLKPHYEAQKSQLKKGVLEPEYLDQVVSDVKSRISSLGFPLTHSVMWPLRLFVSKWFQVLFHRGQPPTFHLSLTVLVHYRSQKVFSLAT